MADSNNVLMILTGGVGATVGGPLTAVVQTLSGRASPKPPPPISSPGRRLHRRPPRPGEQSTTRGRATAHRSHGRSVTGTEHPSACGPQTAGGQAGGRKGHPVTGRITHWLMEAHRLAIDPKTSEAICGRCSWFAACTTITTSTGGRRR